jgi:hypothetical protein
MMALSYPDVSGRHIFDLMFCKLRYLALALFLFRKRTELRQPAVSGQGGPVSRSSRGSTLGRAPFVWLPAFNLTVIALQLLYQAPLW